MRYVLLTWNPGSSDSNTWTPEQYRDAVVVPTRGSATVELGWSVGNHTNIEVGARAFLHRQGLHGRGILAAGTILSEPETDVHWADPEKTSNYVRVEWFDAVEVPERLDIAILERDVPEVPWHNIPGSGRTIPEAQGQRIARLFAARSGGDISPPSPLMEDSGQGFGDAAHNALVEAAAMERTTEEWECAGFVVEDVSAQKLGWDLDAYSPSETFHIEVKGVSGSGLKVRLTANEHRAMSEQADWALAIVTNALDPVEQEYHEFLDPLPLTGLALPMTYSLQIPGDV